MHRKKTKSYRDFWGTGFIKRAYDIPEDEISEKPRVAGESSKSVQSRIAE